MFGWDENRDNYQQVYENDQPNKSSLGHEVVAGGAAFAAMKMYEDHQRKEGKPIEHQFAKEMLAGFAGAAVDNLAETKGEDWFDKEKTKHQAKREAENMYDQQYGQYDQYDPNQQQPHQQLQDHFGGDRWN